MTGKALGKLIPWWTSLPHPWTCPVHLLRSFTVQMRECKPKCLEKQKALYNAFWRFGGTNPAALPCLLFQQSPRNLPDSHFVPSPPHSTGPGRYRIQVKPTKDFIPSLWLTHQGSYLLFSHWMRTRKQTNPEAAGRRLGAGRGEHA